jgi:ankyrin repeat protein
LQYGADLSHQTAKRYPEDDSYPTPLLYRVIDEVLPDIARELVEGGADINAVGPDRRTPLDIAAEKAMIETVELLISKGAIATQPRRVREVLKGWNSPYQDKY